MSDINLENIIAWEKFAGTAIALGVRSWTVIRAAMQDANVDDATIEALQPKWDALVEDVKRAAGL